MSGLAIAHPPLEDSIRISDFCMALKIARSTFYDWRAKGRAPRCIKLPNGDLRIRLSDYESWLDSRLDKREGQA
jgi:predicted DNA-binding transcriptional regulator AlpA